MRNDRHAIDLADALPELARGLSEEDRRAARRFLVTRTVQLRPGDWTGESLPPVGEGHLGYLVVEGFLSREVTLGDTVAMELIGRGDLLRPGEHDGEEAPIPFSAAWTVLQPTRVVSLDARFVSHVGRWPTVLEAIVSRMVRRANSLALHLAVSHLRRVDERLLALMWHLADRWGHVETGGVKVPLRLTHQALGRLVGAQRPSVTTALRQLSDSGLVSRAPDGTWLVHGEPPGTADLTAGASAREHVGGEAALHGG
jgi:CRP/FNR family transcriptional regulator, cyclic AMP receptor protein